MKIRVVLGQTLESGSLIFLHQAAHLLVDALVGSAKIGRLVLYCRSRFIFTNPKPAPINYLNILQSVGAFISAPVFKIDVV
jgi:hypothetical protein